VPLGVRTSTCEGVVRDACSGASPTGTSGTADRVDRPRIMGHVLIGRRPNRAVHLDVMIHEVEVQEGQTLKIRAQPGGDSGFGVEFDQVEVVERRLHGQLVAVDPT
jgi:hypothetical protein